MAALRFIRRYGLYFLAFIFLFAIDFDVLGRPGGGNSFGGGSSGGGMSGGSGGGDGDIGWLIYLVVRYPEIGIPLVVIFIAYKIYQSRNRPQQNINSSQASSSKVRHQNSVQHAVDMYKLVDENFSQTLFLDFSQHLYYQMHFWRGKSEYHNLKPYLHENVFHHEEKMARAGIEVSELVIGAAYISDLQRSDKLDSITVRFEASYTETHAGHASRFQTVDQWIFVRQPGVKSKGPDEMTGLHCPNCGSHLELTPTGACHNCGQVVQPGNQHWMLYQARHLQRRVSKGKQFGAYEAEQGNRLPTVKDPSLERRGRDFVGQHQIGDFKAYFNDWCSNVVVPMFKTIYEEWENREYRRSRAMMTDNMFRTHYYWINAYKENGLVNRLKNLEVRDIEMAKIEMDKYYESITVRIYAGVIDYLETDEGKLIGGSKRATREYTEYWTLVRRAGLVKTKSPEEFSTDNCPNCGAPMDMGMTGVCSYCNSKVTTGDFGWILARITQDEVYYG